MMRRRNAKNAESNVSVVSSVGNEVQVSNLAARSESADMVTEHPSSQHIVRVLPIVLPRLLQNK